MTENPGGGSVGERKMNMHYKGHPIHYKAADDLLLRWMDRFYGAQGGGLLRLTPTRASVRGSL